METNTDSEIYSRNGIFLISSNEEVTGTLTLHGEDSVLHIWATRSLNILPFERETITGILDDQTMVSLIDCLVVSQKEFFGNEGNVQHYKLFPQYAVIGQRHYSSAEKSISRVQFIIDDAITLFHDYTSFGTVSVPPDQISDIKSIEAFGKIPFEESHVVFSYWTGKFKIFSVNTKVGGISAFHRPTYGMGSSKGASISNEIVIEVEFSEPLSISNLDSEIRNLLRFFDYIAGRPQNLLQLEVADDSDYPRYSAIHINMYPRFSRGDQNQEPSVHGMPISAANDPEEFSHLLRSWLEKDDVWHIARNRFSAGWVRGRYDPDRLVGAANLFDLLPEEAVPLDTNLENCLEAAIQESRTIFKNLEQSEKRDQILGFLGRLKKPTLKDKIRHRSSIIKCKIGSAIPEIDSLTDAAVDLRNLFVHGGSLDNAKSRKLQESMCFLTDTLEFVFCASDLAEAGWDIKLWQEKPKVLGHPFANYLFSYSKNFSKFRE